MAVPPLGRCGVAICSSTENDVGVRLESGFSRRFPQREVWGSMSVTWRM